MNSNLSSNKFQITKLILVSILSVGTLLALLAPSLVLAQVDRIVPKCDSSVPYAEKDKWCDFAAFVQLLNNLLKWMVGISVPLATILIVYGGFIMITAPTDSGQRTKAKDIFWAAIVGLVAILAAYLVIDTILKQLTGKGISERPISSVTTLTTKS